jgi:hypothetical protein
MEWRPGPRPAGQSGEGYIGPPALVRSAPKSLRPSGRKATASPSMSALSAARPRTAAAILGNLSVKIVP